MQDSYLARYNLTKFLFLAAILLCFIIAYWTVYQKMSIRWPGGDNNYCYLVIPLFAYLLWDKRKKLAQSSKVKAQSERLDNNGQSLESNFDSSEAKNTLDKEGFWFGEFSWSILGLVPIFFSIGLIFVGEMGSVETLLYIGIWGSMVGLVMVLYGWRFADGGVRLEVGGKGKRRWA